MVSAGEDSGPDRAWVKSSAADCYKQYVLQEKGSGQRLDPLTLLRSQAEVYMVPCALLSRSLGPAHCQEQQDSLWSGISHI